MIYLNNAATTYPKPQCVLDAHAAVLRQLPSGQFRSSAEEQGEDILDTCRKNLAKLFHISDPNGIYFTSGATDSMNAVLCGLDLKGKQILTTVTEHNSVLRPLFNQEAIINDPDFLPIQWDIRRPIYNPGAKIILAPCDSYGRVSPEAIEQTITKTTGVILINHCSNVTGYVQDLCAIGKIAKKYGLLFIVDASQSAGCLPIYGDEWNIDALIFTGHKSLFGVQGTGGFYIRKEVPLQPFRFGGTGRDSTKLYYTDMDYEYEPGTQNVPGIAALNAGVSYILKCRLEQVIKKETVLMKCLYNGLKVIPGVTVYGTPETNKGPLLGFQLRGFQPADVAYILQNVYGIIVRAGIQCAPLIHWYLGTEPFGIIRVSVSYLTNMQNVESFLDAIKAIRNSGKVL